MLFTNFSISMRPSVSRTQYDFYMKLANLRIQGVLKTIEGIRKQDENSIQEGKRLQQEATQLINNANKQP